MKFQVQPGKRLGLTKTLFNGDLDENNLRVNLDGQVVVTFVAHDIYTPKATQRFSITLSQTEIDLFAEP